MEDFIVCLKCGKQCSPRSRFCSQCGSAIERIPAVHPPTHQEGKSPEKKEEIPQNPATDPLPPEIPPEPATAKTTKEIREEKPLTSASSPLTVSFPLVIGILLLLLCLGAVYILIKSGQKADSSLPVNPDLLTDIKKDFPDIYIDIKQKTLSNMDNLYIYSYDLSRDGRAEFLVLVPSQKTHDNNYLLIIKYENKEYKVLKEKNLGWGYLSSDIKLLNLMGTPQRQLLVSLAGGGSGGYGTDFIIYYREPRPDSPGGFSIRDTGEISKYPVKVLNIDSTAREEILASELVASSTAMANKVLIQRIYVWDGDNFQDVSGAHPDFYREFSDRMKKEIETGDQWDYGYADDRCRGMIRAWKMGNLEEGNLSPEETLKTYFQLNKQSQLSTAYAYLSQAWHEWQPYGQYVKVNSDSLGKFRSQQENIKLVENKGNIALVGLTLKYYRPDGSFIRDEEMIYELVKEDGIWKIDRAKLNKK